MFVFENGKYQHILCDAEGCEVKSPPAAEVIEGGGLVNMGWECHGGTHFCPTHSATAKAAE